MVLVARPPVVSSVQEERAVIPGKAEGVGKPIYGLKGLSFRPKDRPSFASRKSGSAGDDRRLVRLG